MRKNNASAHYTGNTQEISREKGQICDFFEIFIISLVESHMKDIIVTIFPFS